jgi:hypothetical protein
MARGNGTRDRLPPVGLRSGLDHATIGNVTDSLPALVTAALGWGGSALLIYSLLQTRVLRFRLLNLAAAVVLVIYNALVAVWPMVGMNVVIVAINLVQIARMLRTRHDDRHYDVVPIGTGEPYLRHVLAEHRADIERFNPPQALVPDAAGSAFLVLHRGETVGVVLARPVGPGTAQVDLDYVLPRFRDFTPGEFVYRSDGVFAAAGVRRLLAPPRMREAAGYLARVGFRPDPDDTRRLVLDLPGPASPAATAGQPGA